MGPAGNGFSQETGLFDAWPKDGPPLLWSKSIGTGYSAPSVRDGKLVLFHRWGKEEIVECFAADTGNPLWRYTYPSNFIDPYGYNNGPRCTPILTEKFVYTFGAQGVLTCLQINDGKMAWQHKTHEDWNVPEAFFGVGSTPLLDNGRLYVMVGGQPNSGIVALDAKTGDTVWEAVGRDTWQGAPMTGWRGSRTVDWQEDWKLASYSSPVLAAIHGTPHLLCLMRQGLVSLDPSNGKVRFKRWFRAEVNESVNAMTPVVHGDRIFIANSYYRTGCLLLEVNAGGNGVKEIWHNENMANHFDTPKWIDGHLYGISGRHEYMATLRCIDWETGNLLWQTDGIHSGNEAGSRPTSRSDLERRFGRGSCIVAGGKFIILTEWGRLILAKCSPSGYQEIGRFHIPDFDPPTWTAPVLSNGRLYLRNGDRLSCYTILKKP